MNLPMLRASGESAKGRNRLAEKKKEEGSLSSSKDDLLAVQERKTQTRQLWMPLNEQEGKEGVRRKAVSQPVKGRGSPSVRGEGEPRRGKCVVPLIVGT